MASLEGQEMVDILDLRVEDPQRSTFPTAVKLDALNMAQRKLVNMIDNAFLTELATTIRLIGNATYRHTFAAISAAGIIRNGIVAAVFWDQSRYNYFLTFTPYQDVKRFENAYLAGSQTNPTAYIYDEVVRLSGTWCVNAQDYVLYYFLHNPDDLDDTSTTCDLHPSIQGIVLDLAEAQLWRMDAKLGRAAAAEKAAMDMINWLNKRAIAERPKGVGTKYE